MYYQLFSRISHLESFVLSLNQLFVLPINLGTHTPKAFVMLPRAATNRGHLKAVHQVSISGHL